MDSTFLKLGYQHVYHNNFEMLFFCLAFICRLQIPNNHSAATPNAASFVPFNVPKKAKRRWTLQTFVTSRWHCTSCCPLTARSVDCALVCKGKKLGTPICRGQKTYGGQQFAWVCERVNFKKQFLRNIKNLRFNSQCKLCLLGIYYENFKNNFIH